MKKIFLVRHGESIWNKENRFAGWSDVPLTEKGIEEARSAGRVLKEKGCDFDIAYTSVLIRSKDTLKYIILEMEDKEIEIIESWKLNERHYGALQGVNRDEAKKIYGEEQVQLWRRSVYETPPMITKDDERYPGNDDKYKDLNEDEIPLAENLADTIKRVSDYYENEIEPKIKEGNNILIVAHGNSLRALIKYLDNLSDEEIMKIELKTGAPVCYELDDECNAIKHYYV